MDFFEHQERARKKSGVLLLYFLIAVTLIVLAVYLVIVLFFYAQKIRDPENMSLAVRWWYPELFAGVSVGTLGLVLLGSAFKTISLRSGGAAVAGMLGGLPIDPETRDVDQRKILNVVEEMSIASGVPRPPVFLLEEESGINAFAAGYNPSDAVIGVTKGCIQELSRDELQGVIAHEFSHILNGDMRINIRLVGLLHGILLIAMIGEILMRSSFNSGSRRRRSDKDGGGALMILLFGLALLTIGYVGVFFGKLIKSAVSRQREFLADASAVQFTRNPAGIAGALKKIGGFVKGSRIKNAHAEEASHFFFGDGVRHVYFNALATHPPIEERIRRIDPSFELPEKPKEEEEVWLTEFDRKRTVQVTSQMSSPRWEGRVGLAPAAFVAQTGAPSPKHLDYAHRMRESLPNELIEGARDAFGARAIVYGLLLDPDKEVRQGQLDYLAENAEPGVLRDLRTVGPEIRDLSPVYRLPLIDLCLPGLKRLSENQYRNFRENVRNLVHADRRLNLFEFVLGRILVRHLDPHFFGIQRNVIRYKKLEPVKEDLSVVLSTLAHLSSRNPEQSEEVYHRAIADLDLRAPQPSMTPQSECNLSALAKAIDNLAKVAPMLKKKILQGCAEIILSDRKVDVKEAELLRVVADSLDCPVPPLLPED
jgi:Zn-dependent protease with chaperone function